MVVTHAALAALTVASAGNAATTLLAASDVPTGVAPWVQAGGGASAVVGLVYVARLIANGRLVPREVKDAEAELRASILAAAQREERVLRLAEERAEDAREERAQRALDREQRDRMVVALADVAREMADWRVMRARGTRYGESGPPEGARAT